MPTQVQVSPENRDCQSASRSILKDFTDEALTISAGTVFDDYNAPQDDFVTIISTAVYRKKYIQFCVENAKSVIFCTFILKKHLRIQLYILRKMLIKGNVIFIAFKALKCGLTEIIYQKKMK